MKVEILATHDIGEIEESFAMCQRKYYKVRVGNHLKMFTEDEIRVVNPYDDCVKLDINAQSFEIICESCYESIMTGYFNQVKLKDGRLIILGTPDSVSCEQCSQ